MANQPPKYILITGGTDGVGLAMAKKYARYGHRVIVTGRKPLAHPETLFGDAAITYIRADQSEPFKAATRIEQAMETLGWKGCDLAILNAGVGWAGHPADEPASSIDEQIAVNLRAPVQIASAIAPRLFAVGGQITFIGSVAHKGAKGFATYAATKAGLHGLARSLREEWRGRVLVQMLHPGAMRTGMHSKAGLNVGVAKMMFANTSRATNAIMAAIESGVPDRKIGKRYIWRKGWRVPKQIRTVADQ